MAEDTFRKPDLKYYSISSARQSAIVLKLWLNDIIPTMGEEQPGKLRFSIKLDAEREKGMIPEEISFWNTMAETIQEMGGMAPKQFSGLLVRAHKLGLNNIREYIQAGKEKGMASDFELELERKIGLARKKWCRQHNKDSGWTLNLLNNSTDNLKGLFRIEPEF